MARLPWNGQGLGEILRKRSPALLMLVVIAFQGAGALRTLHLAIEYVPAGEHGAQSGLSGTNAGSHSLVSAESKPSRVHCHDPATCPVCQALASLHALPVAFDASSAVGAPPAVKSAAPESILNSRRPLTDCVPRAPPSC